MDCMNTPTRRHRQPYRRRGERASAIILVIVSLVLMALIGAAYLQQTRVQRFAVAEQGGNIDSVVAATLAQIQATLGTDLTAGDQLELYDYPWTNQSTDSENRFDAIGWGGDPLTPQATGRYQDDMWLAAPAPADLDGTPYWPHITNLNGLFLSYDRSTNTFDVDGEGIPLQDVVDFNGSAERTDTGGQLEINIDNTSGFLQLVDASGDGVPDSRWTWAPIQQIDDVVYVMAVRIVDLSSKINVNTAMTLTNAGGVVDDTDTNADRPQWDLPTEFDLGRFVYERYPSAMGSDNELEHLLAYRFHDASLTQTFPVRRDERQAFWENQGRFSSTPEDSDHRRYALNNEYELRNRDGLNSGRQNARALLRGGEGMPDFLRGQGKAEERDYTMIDGNDPGYAGGPTDWTQLRPFYELEPRKHLTTLSGAANFRWPLLAETFAGSDGDQANMFLKADLNEDDPEDIFTAFGEVYASHPPSLLPGGFDPPAVAIAAAQFAANVANYRSDADHLIEVDPDPDDDTVLPRYGLVPLPMITEVYTQGKYEPRAVEEPAGAWQVVFDRLDPVGFALEFRNPFDRPAKLETVELWVGDERWGRLSDLANGKAELQPGEVLILYRHSHTGTDGDGSEDDLTGLISQDPDHEDKPGTTDPWEAGPPAYDVQPITLPDTVAGWPVLTGESETVPQDVTVELRPTIVVGETAPGIADWPYFTADSFRYPDTIRDDQEPPYTEDPVAAEPGAPSHWYWQHSVQGDGRGLNPIALGANNLHVENHEPEWVVGGPHVPYDGAVPALGERTKENPNHDATLEGHRLHVRQDAVTHVGEAAHLFVLGPNGENTLAEEWAAASLAATTMWTTADDPDPNDFENIFLLNFDPAVGLVSDDPTLPVQANHVVTHAAMVVDRFTTLSPSHAGVTVDTGGQMVPGLVNLNTMPPHLLDQVLPIEDGTVRGALIDRLVQYRDATSAADREAFLTSIGHNVPQTELRENPGFANVGELFLLLEGLDAADPELPRHEQVKLARWLSQIGSARSDYFVAYVYIRGYQQGMLDMSPADNAIRESARFIAVFERNVASGKVRVAALLPGQDPYMVR